MPVAGAVSMDTVVRRQRSVLRYCRCLGCMQWHVGNSAIRHNHTDTCQSFARNCITNAGATLFRAWRYFCCARFLMWKSKNTDSGHTVGDDGRAVRYAWGALGNATEKSNGIVVTKYIQLAFVQGCVSAFVSWTFLEKSVCAYGCDVAGLHFTDTLTYIVFIVVS